MKVEKGKFYKSTDRKEGRIIVLCTNKKGLKPKINNNPTFSGVVVDGGVIMNGEKIFIGVYSRFWENIWFEEYKEPIAINN